MLATFKSDQNVYRAVCISVSPIDCKVSYIDYGSDGIVGFDDVWKMPKQFLVPCVSRTVQLKLASGKELKNINVADTMENLLAANKFNGVVECLPGNKYTVTVDDSLIIFM